MGALRHLTDEVLRVLRVRALHRPDHECRLTISLLDPEDDLIEMLPIHVHHHGEQPFLALSRSEFQIGIPPQIRVRRMPDFMDTVIAETDKICGL